MTFLIRKKATEQIILEIGMHKIKEVCKYNLEDVG